MTTAEPSVPGEEVRRVVVMGVQGSGKTTLGTLLATALGWRFVDGDTLHSEAARLRMAAGIPLGDEDRRPWLDRVGAVLGADEAVVVGCSALRRRYRDQLRSHAPDAFMVHAHGSVELLTTRVGHREHEYMPASLLQSLLDTLEPLEADEAGMVVDIAETPQQILTRVLARLRPARSGADRSGPDRSTPGHRAERG